jgi:VanZ family protein
MLPSFQFQVSNFMFLRYNLAAILWAVFIFILCVLPGYAIPHYSWTDLLSVDKLVHAFLFAVLTLLLIRGFTKQTEVAFLKSNTLSVVFFISVLYGGLLELMQNYCLTDRNGSWFDLIADAIGAIIGIVFYTYLKKKKHKFFGLGFSS